MGRAFVVALDIRSTRSMPRTARSSNANPTGYSGLRVLTSLHKAKKPMTIRNVSLTPVPPTWKISRSGRIVRPTGHNHQTAWRDPLRLTNSASKMKVMSSLM